MQEDEEKETIEQEQIGEQKEVKMNGRQLQQMGMGSSSRRVRALTTRSLKE
jgi:hypothetical protein